MSSNEFGTADFNSSNVDLATADPRDVICAIAASANEYDGQLGARISALFVIMIVSTCATFFPVVAKRIPRLHIPLYVYLFARYFGAGVIVATAFIHLLDPAYSEIGPQTCVGMTGGWAQYSWCPAIVLTSVMMIFLLDFGAERYVELKYGVSAEQDIQGAVTGVEDGADGKAPPPRSGSQANIALGIGARMSAIPFKPHSWLPWALCAAYGLTTPVAIAVGLGVRTTYNPNSFTANVVSGVLDSMSAGILIYTGLVELLARDFLFNPLRTKDSKRLAFMMATTFLGAGLMALLGKWA